MIEVLDDIEGFRRRRRLAWEHNVDYWLNERLRHVEDVGPHIVQRVKSLCELTTHRVPVVADMGFGSGWLLRALLEENVRMSYIGIDSMETFVERANSTYSGVSVATFIRADLECELDLPIEADVVVNSFNFLELADLAQAMANTRHLLRPGGRVLMSTIDKTYLLLALSNDWADFHRNLRLYQDLPGVKFGFQRVDLGEEMSKTLEYPSVLYSIPDFVGAALEQRLLLTSYVEQPFTARFVPKIYCHLEFQCAVASPD